LENEKVNNDDARQPTKVDKRGIKAVISLGYVQVRTKISTRQHKILQEYKLFLTHKEFCYKVICPKEQQLHIKTR
jgi:hypothetical protein